MPTAPGTRCGGNSSRMMPNASGSTPPPAPWMTRARIITGSEPASPAIRLPTARAPSAATKTRFLPTMSPSRPRIGVHTAAERKFAVSTHETSACVVSSSRCRIGSTGLTIDWSRTNEMTPTAMTP